jgi:hypothetical protein
VLAYMLIACTSCECVCVYLFDTSVRTQVRADGGENA